MNTEIFVAVLAALVVYRVLSPMIDAINPLTFFARPKAISAAATINGKSSAGTGLAK